MEFSSIKEALNIATNKLVVIKTWLQRYTCMTDMFAVAVIPHICKHAISMFIGYEFPYCSDGLDLLLLLKIILNVHSLFIYVC